MTRSTGPADVREMGIVHSALRRDLERVRLVLASSAPVSDERRTAVAEHLLWMIDFLHRHHAGEDTAIWPAVRQRNAAAAELLDVMDADHQRIGPHLDAVEAAAARWRSDPGAQRDVTSALSKLVADLLPHLRREEEQMMPLDDEGREHMLGKVPAPVAFFLVHVFGPGYRRRARRMWADTAAAAVPSLSLAHLDQTPA